MYNQILLGGAMVGANQLREKYLPMFYESEINQLKIMLVGQRICITVDETTDICGRAAVNILFSFKNQTKLVATKHLIKVDNVTISQLVMTTLQLYSISYEDVIFYISDNASYMIKSFQNLKPFFPNIYHNTCLAHIYNLVGGTWLDHSQFKLLDNIISLIKASFTYCSTRKRRWISHLSLNAVVNLLLPFNINQNENSTINITLPPLPVKTRWNSWFKFVFWINQYIPFIITF